MTALEAQQDLHALPVEGAAFSACA